MRSSSARLLSDLEQVAWDHWKPEVFRRFQCIWLMQILQLPATVIAEGLGLSVSTVRRLHGSYRKHGVAVIYGDGNRGGRRNHYMTLVEESAFLRRHKALLDRSAGGIHGIKAAFEAEVGHPVHKTTIYRMLRRHGKRATPGTKP